MDKAVNGEWSMVNSLSLNCMFYSQLTVEIHDMFAEIIIPLALPKNYTWSVPDHLKDQLHTGCRVEVNLGKNKKYAGIVKRLHNEKPDFFEAKDILNVLDVEPVVFEEQLKIVGVDRILLYVQRRRSDGSCLAGTF